MKIKLISVLIVTFIFRANCYSQQESFVDISNIDRNYYDSSNLIVPKYKIKLDKNKNLFYKDSLVFTPKDKYKYCSYQFFTERFLIITGYTEKQYKSNIRALFPKNNVIVIDKVLG